MKKKRILFVCIENSCRSQMAEGIANRFGADVVEACSAGSKPSGTVNPMAIRMMGEMGIDISGARSKGFAEVPGGPFDFVITLGCEDRCPFVPEGRHIDWHIDDPKDKNEEFFRKVREDIYSKAKRLIDEIRLDNSKEGRDDAKTF